MLKNILKKEVGMRNLIITNLLLLLILFMVWADDNLKEKNEVEKVNHIFELYYNQKFQECMDYCWQVINQDVDNSAAYVFYFSSAYQLDKLQEVINDLDNKYISFIQNFNSTKKNEIIEAQKEYQILTLLNGYSNIFLYFTSSNGNYYLDEGIDTLRKSLFFPVSFSSVYTGLSIAYFEKKLNEKAISMINKALNINPSDPIALEYFAKLQNNLGNYQQTISRLKNYTYIKYPDMLYQLGYAYERNGQYDEALKTYLLAYQCDPNLLGQGFISLVRVGDIYLYIKNDKEKAIYYYQQILKVLPDSLVAKTKIEEAKNYNPKEENKKNNDKTKNEKK